jgi:alpha-L-fucosidase
MSFSTRGWGRLLAFVIGALTLGASVAVGDVRLPAIIGSGMVLQRETEVSLWGWAEVGERVRVKAEWSPEEAAATAGEDGTWRVRVRTPAAGGPFKITVAGRNTLTLDNVLIGEVWICSGQSNMQWSVGPVFGPGVDNHAEVLKAADYPNIRLFNVKNTVAATPAADCVGAWNACTPETASSFSAVGYFFGRDLHDELKVPIGLINSSWGGTPAEAWTSARTLRAVPALAAKVPPESAPALGPHTPAALYNGMIAPLVPFGMRGVIWYQGEANRLEAKLYRTLFPAMIADWRQSWGQGDFPFYYVQIAPFDYGDDKGQTAELREAQLQTLSTPNTGMVVTMDIGNPRDIHPQHKDEVGRRLVLWALAKTYGRPEVAFSGPLYKAMTIEGDRIRVRFDYVEGGLVSRGGGALTHFVVAGEDRAFRPADAAIDGETVVVSSAAVPHPVAVRYAWGTADEPNLANAAGLPASSFRMDDWEGVEVGVCPLVQTGSEAPAARDARLAWWREARFGMFIHWGLYSIPAGEWGSRTDHGEWIRETAQIPIEEYEQLVQRFNPVKFDADEWVRMAKDAGMKYIVITSKHHDGFCLFDSQYTDFDVMSTPFKRDIMKELADACRRQGLRMCWYHSIMDWHHPDYLPRRGWETRPAEGADFNRYYSHLKNQLRELLTNYGPIGILWFDGEWENTWTHAYGQPLYDYVRGLQPDIIVNNRVDKGRGGMAGMTSGAHAGDYGTPEQEIPATGLPGADWETCMTMNDHWGYNKRDKNFKSTRELLRMLADIASKGGNYLLNVGPTAEGEFPAESVARLAEMGRWMKVNGESIYGTQASPFKSPAWGRCTQKALSSGGTRLYLHVFDWPADGRLMVPGLLNEVAAAYLLSDATKAARVVVRDGDALVVTLPKEAPDAINSVVVLDIAGRPDVTDPPVISAPTSIFVDALDVSIASDRENVELRYTTDDTPPTRESPVADGRVRLSETATVRARAFRGGQAVSGIAAATFTKVTPRQPEMVSTRLPGLGYEYFEGDWDILPAFDQLKPVKTDMVATCDLSPRRRNEYFALRYSGFVRVMQDGVYTFTLTSDDGSRLYIGDRLVVDNDGLHGAQARSGAIALGAGAHALTVTYFNKTGDYALDVSYAGPGFERRSIPAEMLLHSPAPTSAAEAAPVPGDLPVPAQRQLAWQELELIGFVHFGMNTFTDREWGEGTEDPKLFNPTDFDARQWVTVCKDAGMKQVIVTAKHHDGFCLWPSKYTEHSVKSSPWRGGQGDVIREVADACRAAGMKLGIYLSPWDRHEPSYGDSPRYNEHYEGQLTELLTGYGPVHEVWFDGACGEGPNGKKQVYDWPGCIEVVRRLQPEAVIFSDAGPDVRWVGNENGFAGETNWSTLRRDEFFPGTPNYRPLTEGHENGTHWVPAECDVSIRPGWFYHAGEDDKVKSVAELVDIYYKSVGRNGVLLLNVPPDQRGRIHENDAARLAELRAVLDETFRTNLATGSTVVASNTREQSPVCGAGKLVDGDSATYWAADNGITAAVLEFTWEQPRTFDRALIMENIRLGQRVKSFELEAWDGQSWQPVAKGTTIGYKRLLRFPAVTAARVRLAIRDARGAPALSEFGLFKASAREGSSE